MPELTELGVQVILVGNGAAHYMDGFIDRHGLAEHKVSVYTDPTLALFALAQMKRSYWNALGPKSIADAARDFAKGHRQTGIEGDAKQLGGTLLVDKSGVVRFHHVNTSIGGHAPMAAVLDIAQKL